MVTLLVRSCGLSAQPINVAGEPATSRGSVPIVAVFSQPDVGVIPTELTDVEPLLNKGEFIPGGKGSMGMSGLPDPLQRPVQTGEKL